jgi:hypothetical protein
VSNPFTEIIREIERLKADVSRIKVQPAPAWVYLSAPLTSTSWDGDSFSTTAKTLIDLSAVFAVPAGVRAVLVKAVIQDSAQATNRCYIVLSPNSAAGSGPSVECGGLANNANAFATGTLTVPCDANGDIYYQIGASGAGTMVIYLQIWGYEL